MQNYRYIIYGATLFPCMQLTPFLLISLSVYCPLYDVFRLNSLNYSFSINLFSEICFIEFTKQAGFMNNQPYTDDWPTEKETLYTCLCVWLKISVNWLT